MRKSILLIVIFTTYFVFGHYQVHCQNNQNSNNNQQTQPNQNVTVTEPVKVLLEPDIEQIESEKGYKTRQEKRDETNATWNRTGIVINSLLFILVLVQAFLSLRGLREMRRQADIVESQAVTMKEQAETMQIQAKVMEDTLEETRSIIKQNERAIKASNRQAKVSEMALKQSESFYYTSERAYLDITDIEFEQTLEQGKDVTLWLTIKNTGKTPAWNVCYTASFGADTIYQEFTAPKNPAEIVGEQFDEIHAGENRKAGTEFEFSIINERMFGEIMNERFNIVLDIFISYNCIHNGTDQRIFRFIYKASKGKFLKIPR